MKQQKEELMRFTTLINPQILSHIKLISYFTNKKLYEVINDSCNEYINQFELQNNTSIKSLINLQYKMSSINLEEINITKDKK
jgi:hypothetical protein